jgi:hypothetical protein
MTVVRPLIMKSFFMARSVHDDRHVALVARDKPHAVDRLAVVIKQVLPLAVIEDREAKLSAAGMRWYRGGMPGGRAWPGRHHQIISSNSEWRFWSRS